MISKPADLVAIFFFFFFILITHVRSQWRINNELPREGQVNLARQAR